MFMHTATTSAMLNAHHTFARPNNLAKINATGRMTSNWRTTEIVRLYTPFPSAWKIELVIMLNPAKIKLRLISFKAGTPICNISFDASKNPKSCSGISWKRANPISIEPVAIDTLSFMVSRIRFLFLAP